MIKTAGQENLYIQENGYKSRELDLTLGQYSGLIIGYYNEWNKIELNWILNFKLCRQK